MLECGSAKLTAQGSRGLLGSCQRYLYHTSWKGGKKVVGRRKSYRHARQVHSFKCPRRHRKELLPASTCWYLAQCYRKCFHGRELFVLASEALRSTGYTQAS